MHLNWKMYFWFILIYEVALITYGYIKNSTSLNYGVTFDFIFIAGVWGFAYKKPILGRHLWLVIFVISIFSFIDGLILSPYFFYITFNSIGLKFIMALWLPFLPLLPMPYILYQYSRKSDGIWNHN